MAQYVPAIVKSAMFRRSARVVQAATVPYLSLKQGEGSTDAVQILQLALYNIQAHSESFPPQYKPKVGDTGNWVVFYAQDEYPSATFGKWTNFSVEAFQTQSKKMKVDGMAGIETLPYLDELIAYLESLGLTDNTPDLD